MSSTKKEYSHSVRNGAAVAVFDFDKTITDRHTFWRFMRYCAGWRKFYWTFITLVPSMIRYYMKRISLMDLRGKAIHAIFGGLPYETYVSFCRAFVATQINNWISAEAAERIQWHREQGHLLVLLSNSPEEYLQIWARQHGFDMVIGSKLEFKNKIASGYLSGSSCFGKEKAVRLDAAIPDLHRHYVYAYGDSPSDRYVLDLASEAYYRKFNLTRKYNGYRQ